MNKLHFRRRARMNAFEKIQSLYGEISDLGNASALLSWDQQTYMPPRGATARGMQLATLSGIIHERMTSPDLGGLIAEASGGKLTGDQAAYLRELSFARDRSMKLPAALVKEMSLEESKAFEAWTRARKLNDYGIFAPHLARVIELKKQCAECWGYAETPWDALATDYERGLTASRVESIFRPLREATVKLLQQIKARPQANTRFLDQKWDIDRQREFGLRVARDIGYDMAAGRQDLAPHPFCTNFGMGDVRITTRYSQTSLLDGLFGTVHETGHAMYEQGFDPADARSPLAEAPSLGVHESQSRFWEVRIAQSEAFWKHYYPILRQYFPGQLDDVMPEEFYRALNIIEPDFIRVEADEICYNLHVIIRFELEVGIFRGDLSVGDIPAAWNKLYKEYLGLDVPSDTLGCLQDVHWAYGSFGYFPTYTLGNIYCAMLVERMERDMPALWEMVAQGQFAPILQWLRENIHKVGRRHESAELIERVTGMPVTCDPLIRHLANKYRHLYGF
ncbi:carboxypeptidase M32 [Candidatus Sumerlaeota bacterium]|nr:carboxypeptidase M32 [Candidatus Sumerlaeota bacterium]